MVFLVGRQVIIEGFGLLQSYHQLMAPFCIQCGSCVARFFLGIVE